MKWGIVFVLVVLLLVWSYILLPEIAKRKIKEEVEKNNGVNLKIQWLSPRSCLFLVEYFVDGTIIRRNVRYSLFADIEWI